jgi:hypothetical protein
MVIMEVVEWYGCMDYGQKLGYGGYNRSAGVSKEYKWDVFRMSMLG